MSRLVVIVALLGGCLDEADRPPGHSHELRNKTVVADLDGDGVDDIITLGHNGDPRTNSSMFLYFGQPGHRFDAPDLEQHLAIDDPGIPSPAWYEAIDAFVFKSDGTMPDGVVVMSGEDPDLPPSGVRHLFATFFPTSSAKALGVPVQQTNDLDAGLGGYASDPQRAFLSERSTGEVLMGDMSRALATPSLGTKPFSDVTYPVPAGEYVCASVPVKPSVDPAEPMLVVTAAATYLTTSAAPTYMLTDKLSFAHQSTLRVVRDRQIDDAEWLVTTDENTTDVISIVYYINDSVAPKLFGTYDMKTRSGGQPDDFGVVDLGNGAVDLVTIEDAQLLAYALPGHVSDDAADRTDGAR